MKWTQITVETLVLKDINTVWKYYTSPNHITKWNFANEEWHCPEAENDLSAGGKFKSTMASKDGKMSFDFEGTYDEVIAHERIAYTMSDGRKAIIHFDAIGNTTKIVINFDAESENPSDMQKAGWQAILDNFKKCVESIDS